jgi:sugar lactone lactonase YvrE
VAGEAAQFGWIGNGLNRPECVLTHASGWTFAASWAGSGGVSAIAPDGAVMHHLADPKGPTIRPNGIALEPDGAFLVAHLGDTEGGVFRLHPDRSLEPVMTDVAGRPIPPSNFPAVDARGRLWLSVSTTLAPRDRDYNPDACTGMILLKDGGRVRVVADGLGYANEILISPDCGTLYANETFRRRLVRYAIGPDGGLVGPEVVTTFGAGTFPDGLAMDCEGGLWITSIVSNRVIRIDPDGGQTVFLEDCDSDHVAWVEKAFLEGTMGLAFGGPDLRTGYLGCLLGDSIATIRLPVAGLPLPHFTYDIDALTRILAPP